MNALTVLASAEGEEFQAPGPELFEFPPLFAGGPEWLTKPVVFAVFGSLLVCALAWWAFAKPKLVPRGMQNLGELGYVFVREQIGRPFLGKDTEAWMPLLFSLFFLIWTWNIFAVVPIIQFPIASHFAFPVVLALSVYFLKVGLGIKKQGLGGYFKNMIPQGVKPKAIYVLLVPIEYLSTLVLAPFTHAVRLFANMFAGHIILAFFSLVGFWFIFEHPTPKGFGLGIAGVIMTIAMTAFEMFIQFLQAFLFTMLAAMYIGSGLHAEH